MTTSLGYHTRHAQQAPQFPVIHFTTLYNPTLQHLATPLTGLTASRIVHHTHRPCITRAQPATRNDPDLLLRGQCPCPLSSAKANQTSKQYPILLEQSRAELRQLHTCCVIPLLLPALPCLPGSPALTQTKEGPACQATARRHEPTQHAAPALQPGLPAGQAARHSGHSALFP